MDTAEQLKIGNDEIEFVGDRNGPMAVHEVSGSVMHKGVRAGDFGMTYEAWEAFTGATEETPLDPDVAIDYEAMTKDELEALASERGLTVEGTGADGAVLKSDLVAALRAADGA